MAMNPRLTQKEVRRGYSYCIYASYGALQNLLRMADKVGHTERREGWGADIYHVNNATCVVTGYAPFGNIHAPYEICKKYDDLADQLYDEYFYHRQYTQQSQDEYKNRINELLQEFCNAVMTEAARKK